MALISTAEPRPESSALAAARQEVTRVAALTDVHAAFAWFRTHQRELTDLQLEITKVAAPPFGEVARAEWLRQRFEHLGLQQVGSDAIGNVVGFRPGSSDDDKVIAITAHLDTVFPNGTQIRVRKDAERIYGPGISDNSAGLIALLAIAAALQAGSLKTTMPILFVGNVGEEGEGNVRGMRYLFGESEWKDRIEHTLVLDGAGTDSIVTQALGSRRYLVTVYGPGGHSWSDFGVPNPIVALARGIDQFSRVPVPATPKTTFNIGIVTGGTSVNSIPESASMRVDLRSASEEEILRMETSLREALDRAVVELSTARAKTGKTERRGGSLTYDMKLIGDRPAAELPASARILAVMQAVDQHLGNTARIQRASTDANIPLSMGKEAVAIGAGGSGGGAHTLQEWYDPTTRELGLKRILLSALVLAGVVAPTKKSRS